MKKPYGMPWTPALRSLTSEMMAGRSCNIEHPLILENCLIRRSRSRPFAPPTSIIRMPSSTLESQEEFEFPPGTNRSSVASAAGSWHENVEIFQRLWVFLYMIKLWTCGVECSMKGAVQAVRGACIAMYDVHGSTPAFTFEFLRKVLDSKLLSKTPQSWSHQLFKADFSVGTVRTENALQLSGYVS